MGKKKKGKKPEEKPTETIKQKPETLLAPEPKAEAAPTPPKPKLEISVAEKIYDYLKKHGATSPLRIAKDLNLNPLEVMKTLNELEKQGKIRLQP